MTEYSIWEINNKKEVKLLRKKLTDFDFSAEGGSASAGKKYSRKDIQELIQKMRIVMKKANGIGLAANQVGLDIRVFVAQLQSVDRHGQSHSLSSDERKFYAIFNPEIIKSSGEKIVMEEGCLSVPGGYFGDVERPAKITLIGFDKNGKKLKIKAWGMLARVFQHEVDHLNGALFIDKAKELHKYNTKITN